MDRAAQADEAWHLMRKVFLLLMLVVALSLGLVLQLERGKHGPLLLFNILVDGSIGAAMGFGSRFVLRRRHWWIRALVAAALSIVGLMLVGSLTTGLSGVGPLALTLSRVPLLDGLGVPLRLPRFPGNNSTDLVDLAHLVLTISVSWASLRAWGGAPRFVPRARESSWRSRPSVSSQIPMAAPRPAPTPGPAPLRVSTPGVATVGPRRGASGTRHSGPIHPRSRPIRPVVKKALAIRPRSGRTRRRSLFQGRSAVQLAAHEEHRCPYCLQEIVAGDGRGSVECPICHTLHHKDCWDITGTCQVPHLNG